MTRHIWFFAAMRNGSADWSMTDTNVITQRLFSLVALRKLTKHHFALFSSKYCNQWPLQGFCYSENWSMTMIKMCLTFPNGFSYRHCGDGHFCLNNTFFPCILIWLKKNSHVIVSNIFRIASTEHEHFEECFWDWSFQASKIKQKPQVS